MTALLNIGRHSVGHGFPAYLVAEVSANHNQDYEQAARIVHAAKDAGADAIKLQTYTPDTITMSSAREEFRVSGGTLWDGRTLHDLYAEAYMPWEWQPRLKALAESLEMDCFSSAFDFSAVDFLEDMNVAAHKVASFELVDIPLIQKMASTGKPLIISTGMASAEEIEEALQAARYLEDKRNTRILAITCGTDTPIEKIASHLIKLPFADEKSTVMTRSFSSMLLVLQSLAAIRGNRGDFLDALRMLPYQVTKRLT